MKKSFSIQNKAESRNIAAQQYRRAIKCAVNSKIPGEKLRSVQPKGEQLSLGSEAVAMIIDTPATTPDDVFERASESNEALLDPTHDANARSSNEEALTFRTLETLKVAPLPVSGLVDHAHDAPLDPATLLDKPRARKRAPKRILGKPVFMVDTLVLNKNSGFVHKRLCSGLTFSAGTACAYDCTYCYSESQTVKQEAVQMVLKESGEAFNQVVIRRRDPARRLAWDLTRKRHKNETARTAEELLPAELIAKLGLIGEWSLANRVPKFCGTDSN